MKERPIVKTDNRDPSTTWLHFADGSYVEVNPAELFSNMIENNTEPKMSEFFNIDDEIAAFLERFEL